MAFTLGAPRAVQLQVFDLQGQLVRTLVSGEFGAGRHTVQWNGRDDRGRGLPSGVYLAGLSDGWQWRSQRLVLVR